MRYKAGDVVDVGDIEDGDFARIIEADEAQAEPYRIMWLKEDGQDDEESYFRWADHEIRGHHLFTLDPAPTASVDVVNHPQHYSEGMPEGVAVIDVIQAQGADFLHGNVIKYILRWKWKNGVEDLKKARTYLGWLIEQEEAKNV